MTFMFQFFAFYFVTNVILLAHDVKISTDLNYFSPNNDGLRDFQVFSVLPFKDFKVRTWKFIIKDEQGKLVRNFEADHRIKYNKSYWSFWNKNPKFDNTVSLPKEILWLGTNLQGKIPPDGRYIYQLSYEDLNGFLHQTKEQYLYLDSQFPLSKVEIEYPIFTPNSDKLHDQLFIKQDIRADLLDRWKGTIRNDKNLPVKTYIWESNRFPKFFAWDGKDDRGIPMETGLYSYELVGEDFSENQSLTKWNFIYLEREPHAIHLVFRNTFYPNEDNYYDFLKIYIFSSTNQKIKTWRLSIKDTNNKEKRFWLGDTSLPNFLDWDGKDEFGKLCKTGIYNISIEAELENGKKISSLVQSTKLIREPIQLEFSVSPKDFTPDNDGVNDYLEIHPKFSNLEFSSWKLSIVEKYKTPTDVMRKVIKSWRGREKIASKILWDGLNENGYKIGSLANLELYFSFRNDQDEYKTFLVKEFETGILVNQIGTKKLLISIPEYTFVERENKVLSDIKKLLERFYSQYKVEIQSHSRQKGDNKENLRKTEFRAKYIFEKMFPNVAINKQYSYRGFGEIEPLYKEETIYFQEKNERIDFHLTLMEKE